MQLDVADKIVTETDTSLNVVSRRHLRTFSRRKLKN